MSLNLIANITLDMLHPYASSTIVQVNQYDTAGSIKATLLNDGVSWNVPQGAKAVVMFKKTDNIGGFYDVTELNPESAAVTVDSNDRSIIYITLDQQTTTTATTAGQYVNMQVAFYQNGARLSTFAFYMQVQPSVVTSGDIHSNWLFNILSQEIAQILTDATTPEFIENWLENNITQETGYVIDDSLTVRGAASDAQATGKMVTVSDTNPNLTANKIWVKKTPSEIVVPTEDEVEDLRNTFRFNSKSPFKDYGILLKPYFFNNDYDSDGFFESFFVSVEKGTVIEVLPLPSGAKVSIRKDNKTIDLTEGLNLFDYEESVKVRVYTQDNTITPANYVNIYYDSYQYSLPNYGYLPNNVVHHFYIIQTNDNNFIIGDVDRRRSSAPIIIKAGDKIKANGYDIYINPLDTGWVSAGTEYIFQTDGTVVITFRDANDPNKDISSDDFTGKILLTSADSIHISDVEEALYNGDSYSENFDYQKIMFNSSDYDDSYNYFPLTIIGHNSEVVICPNGGKLYELIGGKNYPRLANTPMVLNGEHEYRVYNDNSSAVPYYLLKNDSWIGGYVSSSSFNPIVITAGSGNRCTRFIKVDNGFPVDIDCDDGIQFDTRYVTSTEGIDLETRGHKHYTLNSGYYLISIMGANTSAQVTDTMINSIHINKVQFPKITGFPFYEEMCYEKQGAGAQGICCTEENVVLFNGLGDVFIFDFDGNFIEGIEIPRDYGHCNSATYYNGHYFVVDSAEHSNASVVELDDDFELVQRMSIPNISSLAYSDEDGYFYGIKASSYTGHIASGVSLYRYDNNLENETLIKSNLVSDSSYVLQGLEVVGDYIIACLFDTNYYGIIAYFTKQGNLVKWRYAQRANELEDVAVNNNGDMFISYQGSSIEGLPMILTKCKRVITYNATEDATSIASGIKIGRKKDPFILTADEDHVVFNGEINGSIVNAGNLARVSANVLPHVIYVYLCNNFVVSSGSTARNNLNLPLLNVRSGSGQAIEYKDFYLNLKNDRWFTDSL